MSRKSMLAAGILTLIMVSATGCSNEQAAESSSAALSATGQTAEANVDDTSQRGQDGDAPEEDGTKSEGTENNETGSAAHENTETANGAAGSNTSGSGELNIIGGKVRSVSQDSFVISRTLLDDTNTYVMMPEAGSPEEELVTVRWTDSAVFVRWTIQGSGASVTEEEADFSEIQEGTVLEAEGHFEGEEFVAEKVIIEIYE